jgi:release factor glutamine methyltransferase
MTTTSPPPRQSAEPWTIRRVVVWATEDLGRREVESPRLTAELLLAHALGTSRIQLILEADRPLIAPELARYKELLQQRWTGKPTAYLLGEREFYGTSFLVDERVLIPRPDTETLVEAGLRRTEEHPESSVALDLCTGSGCVAIALSQKRPEWSIFATDLSPDALAVARENGQRAGVDSRLTLLLGDLFAAVPSEHRFLLITANPPYIPSADVLELDKGIRDFEPRLALDGGLDGFDIIARIVREAPAWLAPSGTLALEVGFDQAERTESLFVEAGFENILRHRDYGGHERVVSGRIA